MKRSVVVLFGVVALTTAGATFADAKFERLAMRVEQNTTDNDFEIVVEATGGDTGLATLKVAAPDGRVIVDFKSNTKLGMRTFRLETPEPKTLAGLQADFPAGEYTFTASTVAGLPFSGTTTLGHKLPSAAAFISPRPKERNVPVNGLRLQWRAQKNLASILVTIENDVTGVKVVQAALAGSANTFHVPDGVLSPGTEHKIAIGSVASDGNASFVETSFTTAKK